jgi:hypothetical protein
MDIMVFAQFVIVLATWSYMYKENALSKMSAQIPIAVGTVHYAMRYLGRSYSQGLVPVLTEGKILNLIPLLLGLALYTRLTKEYGWVSSYTYAIQLGLGTGAALTTLVPGSIISLIVSTVEKPFAATTLLEQVNGLLLYVGVLMAMSYWIFTREFKGPLEYVLKIGRLFLMVSIGLLYAEDVMWSQSIFVSAWEMVLKFIYVLLGQA